MILPAAGPELMITVFSAPFMAIMGLLLTPRGQRFNGKCKYCSYDLRFSPEVCPECGYVVPAED